MAIERGGNERASTSTVNEGVIEALKLHEKRLSTTYKILLYLGNSILLGLSFVLFIVGIIYLSAYDYEHSFTNYSIKLMGGFFIAIGVIVFLLAIGNITSLLIERSIFFFFSSIIFLLCFITLIILGIYGLVTLSNGVIKNEIFESMKYTLRYYQETSPDKEETVRFDWLQRKFKCCGIYSANDWRSYYLNGGVNLKNDETDVKSVIDVNYVPDSCCIRPLPFCGKLIQNSNYNHGIRNSFIFIYTHGCLPAYFSEISKELYILAGLSLAIGVVCMFISLMFIYILLKLCGKNL